VCDAVYLIESYQSFGRKYFLNLLLLLLLVLLLLLLLVVVVVVVVWHDDLIQGRRLLSSLPRLCFSANLFHPAVPSRFVASNLTAATHPFFCSPTGRLPYIFHSKIFLGVLDPSVLQMCPSHSSLPSLVYVTTTISLYVPYMKYYSLHFPLFALHSSDYFPFKGSKLHYHLLGHNPSFDFPPS
jgi:hypothetical protein